MKRFLLMSLAAAVLAGCGPTPPQAPLPDAKKLDESTGDISSACGGAYQLSAFGGDHRKDLITLEATASSAAYKLAGVYHRNPAWIYQGETIGQIVSDADSMLGACGLPQAQSALRRATR